MNRGSTLGLVGLLAMASVASAQPVGTGFTYQGRLLEGGNPASSPVDVRFTLFDAATGGSAVGPVLQSAGVTPVDGVIGVVLDFGAGVFGQSRWVEIAVAPAGSGVFTALSPRQAVRATPQAQFAVTAESAGTLGGQGPSFFQNASNLASGTIPSGRISGAYSSAVTFSNAGNSFAGSGGGLTGLNAGNVSSGVLSDARLSTNVARLNGTNAFTGANTFGSIGVGGPAAAPVDLTLGDKRLQMRLDGGLVPGIVAGGTGGNLGVLRLRNVIEVHPNDGGTSAGRLDVRNTAGNAQVTLYGDTGDVFTNGSLVVDADGSNGGTLSSAIRLGGTSSGEGIWSRRSGANVFGLDLVTAGLPRVSVTNAGDIGIGTATPGAKLDVAGTVRGTSVQFGDGSVQTRAALDPGRTGATSGLASTARYRVLINGVEAAGVQLSAAPAVDMPLDPETGSPAGPRVVGAQLKLRRSAAGGALWYTIFQLNQTFGTVTVELTQSGVPGSSPRVVWNFGAVRTSAWRVFVGDDGGPVEEITAWFSPTGLTRTRTGTFTGQLPTAGARSGVSSGGESLFRARIAGQLLTGSVASGDLSQSAPIDLPSGQRAGAVRAARIRLRSNATESVDLYARFTSVATVSVEALAFGSSQIVLFTGPTMTFSRWSLEPTDDGGLVEEYQGIAWQQQ